MVTMQESLYWSPSYGPDTSVSYAILIVVVWTMYTYTWKATGKSAQFTSIAFSHRMLSTRKFINVRLLRRDYRTRWWITSIQRNRRAKTVRNTMWLLRIHGLLTDSSHEAFSAAELRDIFTLNVRTDGCQTRTWRVHFVYSVWCDFNRWLAGLSVHGNACRQGEGHCRRGAKFRASAR